MTWQAEVAVLGIDETSPGSTADGPWITLMPNEGVHYTVKRTDGGGTDRWYIDVISSTDGVREDDPPMERFVMGPTQLVKSIPVALFYAFLIRIGNQVLAPTDTIETDHYYRKNGVNL